MSELMLSSAAEISNFPTFEENFIQNEPKHRISKRDLSEEDESHNILETIETASQQYENNRKPKSDNTVEEERLAAGDINWGVTILGNSIRFISAIFTIIGGDSVDRVDGYDTAVSSFFTLAGSVLKYFSGQLLSNEASSPLSKIDISNLSEEEILQKQQLAAYIANLSPDEIKNKQDLVLQHVQQEAIKNGLTELEAQKLLVETLQGNGLPLIEGLDPAATGQVDLLAPLAPVAGLFAGVGETLSSMLGTNIEKTGNTEEEIPGLPTPGTLNYAVTMALFKASESVNGFLNGLTGGSQIQQVNIPNNKIDQDDLQSSSSSNIFSTIGSFLPGSQNLQVSLDPSNSGALTNVAVSPAIIGLGLIATGLLGGVAYASSSNRRSDLATSASSLAKGAVDAIRKNPIVQKIEDTVLGFTGKNPYATKKDTADPYVFYPDYDQGYNGQYSYQGYEDPRVENYERLVEYPDYEYVDPREQVRAPSQPHYQTYQPETTAADGEVSESFTLADASQHKINQAIPDHVVFYEPDTKIEVVTYNEEHNPWEYLHNGQSTDHLYSRGFK